MIHAIGVRSEAQTECFAMQVSLLMAVRLGVPLRYSQQLARLTLSNYFLHPPEYVDTIRCREGGVWNLEPNRHRHPGTTCRWTRAGAYQEEENDVGR